jgi:hypothetical protein
MGHGAPGSRGEGVVRRLLPWAALAVGAALLVAAALDRDGGVTLPQVDAVEARADLAVEGHRFGDAVPGRLDVLVPNDRVDPGTVTLDADFAPYELTRPPRVGRLEDGATTLLRFDFELRCLAHECLPRSTGGGGLLLAPATIRYTGHGGAPASVGAGWETLPAGTWLDDDAAELLAWRTALEPLPALDYRVPPRLLAVLLLALALAAAAGGAALLLPRIRDALPRPRPAGDDRSVLERALAAVRSAAGGGDAAERRRALDFLARELRAGARRGEARAARRLAWSRRSPRPSEMEALADRVEGAA